MVHPRPMQYVSVCCQCNGAVLIGDPKKFFSIACEYCSLTLSFAMATALLLSQCTGGGRCWYSSLSSVRSKMVLS